MVVERRGNHPIVGRRVGERPARQVEAERRARRDRPGERREHARRSRPGSTTTSTSRKFLAARAHQPRPADVDLLDEIVERRIRATRPRRERIEIDDHQVDRRDAVGRRARHGRRRRCRRARMPACTFGCSVFTRPSIISGKPVTSEIPATGSPAARRARAVPPVDTSSHPAAARAVANGTRPGLVRHTQQRAHAAPSAWGRTGLHRGGAAHTCWPGIQKMS